MKCMKQDKKDKWLSHVPLRGDNGVLLYTCFSNMPSSCSLKCYGGMGIKEHNLNKIDIQDVTSLIQKSYLIARIIECGRYP